MNSGARDKMYNYEVSPPNGIWEKISAELDESESGAKFPFKLRNFTVIPPVEAWHKIVAYLDENSLVSAYAARLGGISVPPPASAWNKIQAGLDAEEKPAITRSIPWFRYAAAAAIIGLLVWAGSGLLGKKSGDTEIVKITPALPEQSATSKQDAQPISPIDSTEIKKQIALDDARNEIALEESKKTFAKLDMATRNSKVQNAADFFFATESSTNETTTRGFSFGNEDSDCLEVACRYVMLMTPEGNIIRMSKKLSDLVCCVSGEEQDKDCVDQMKKWREKLAYTPSGHSPGNFIELLNLVNALQEQEP